MAAAEERYNPAPDRQVFFRGMLMMIHRFLLGHPAYTAAFSALALVASLVTARAAAPMYQATGKQHLEGVLRWDYLAYDASERQLYMTHGDQVNVFDTVSKTVVGHIADVHGVHGVALAPAIDRGFTSNGKDNSVSIFALSSREIVGVVATERNPDAIVYYPATRRVFTANGGSASVRAINHTAGRALKSIALGGKPEFAVVDGKGHLFINLEDKNSVAVIDTRTLVLTQRYDLASVCNEPAGQAIDSVRAILFVGCRNQKMAIVDANTGAVIAALPIGSGNDATVFDPETRRAFSSNGDGTLTVVGVGVDADEHFRMEQNVTTMRGARTMALDPLLHTLYLLAAEIDQVPAATPENPRPRPVQTLDSLTLITVSSK